MRLVKLGLACVNATVGSVHANTDRVMARARELEAAGVTVACFPEQVIGGYPAEDLVQWQGFVAAQWQALERISASTAKSGMVTVVGLAVASFLTAAATIALLLGEGLAGEANAAIRGLLIASLIYQFTGLGFVDSLGALGLIYFSVTEGRESFEKAASLRDDCCDDD